MGSDAGADASPSSSEHLGFVTWVLSQIPAQASAQLSVRLPSDGSMPPDSNSELSAESCEPNAPRRARPTWGLDQASRELARGEVVMLISLGMAVSASVERARGLGLSLDRRFAAHSCATLTCHEPISTRFILYTFYT